MVLGGGLFLMSEVPLYCSCPAAAERRGNDNLKGVEDLLLVHFANLVIYDSG